MVDAQLAPTGQSKQVKFAYSLVKFLYFSLVFFLLRMMNDVFKVSLLRVYVPRAHGVHRKVPAFAKCFTLALAQLINSDENLEKLGGGEFYGTYFLTFAHI